MSLYRYHFLFLVAIQFFLIMKTTVLSQLDDNMIDTSLIHDECINARPISINTVNDTVVTLKTVVNTTDVFDLNFEQCDGETLDVGISGVWFVIMDEGRTSSTWMARTCPSDENTTTNLLHRLTIYEGVDCETRTCIETSVENDPECPYPNSSSVKWDVKTGKQYYILIQQEDVNVITATEEEDHTSSEFVLRLKDVTGPPNNSACTSATMLTLEEDPTGINPPTGNVSGSILGSILQGSSSGASIECSINSGDSYRLDESTSVQSSSPISSQERLPVGVWYRISPSSSSGEENESLALFLCSSPVTIGIAVFVGQPCSDDDLPVQETTFCQETEPMINDYTNFSCTNENEIPTNTSWNVIPGQDYYMVIYGTDYANFGLTVLKQIVDDDDDDDDGNSSNKNNADSGSQRFFRMDSTLFVYTHRLYLVISFVSLYQLLC
jgi:hypothetical protein